MAWLGSGSSTNDHTAGRSSRFARLYAEAERVSGITVAGAGIAVSVFMPPHAAADIAHP
jgi:hypothetical protein